MTLKEYVKQINRQYATKKTTEHSYRGILQDFIESFMDGASVVNEPTRSECGAPDYIVLKNDLPVAFIETKNIGDADLDGRGSNKEQFDRYKNSLSNILFTDYLDFHLYQNGEPVLQARIAEERQNKIVPLQSEENESEFERLMSLFKKDMVQSVETSKKLADIMAKKARLLCDVIEKALELDIRDEMESQLLDQMKSFKDVLIYDLTRNDFADMYAQTVVYGLFAARLHCPGGREFSRQTAAGYIPRTNPFLRRIFDTIAGIDLDYRIKWIVDDLISVFNASDLKKIMGKYEFSNGENNPNDPLIHFYEDFLSLYDARLRKNRGVWYTPPSVVGFMVRSVDRILQEDFGLANGLADCSKVQRTIRTGKVDAQGKQIEKKQEFHKVQILDPAVGTGTFLAEIVRAVYERMKGQEGAWQDYVSKNLLPRLNGFEILMASYAIAHIKLDMILSDTGYRHNDRQRLNVFLTNSLEKHKNMSHSLAWAKWLSDEAEAANNVKRDYPVMVMIGNPPYSVSSNNKNNWIEDLLKTYKANLKEKNIQPLSDDYIKFIRLAQHYIEKTGEGVMAYITNNSFTDGIIHRRMRETLLYAFDRIYILNLHGDSRKKEAAPGGGKDENVFDIMQGVSVNVFVKLPAERNAAAPCAVYHADLYGTRQAKRGFLTAHDVSNVEWTRLEPEEPYYFFVPKDFSVQEEYEKGFRIDELFVKMDSGIKTHNDSVNIFFNDDERKQVLFSFQKNSVSELKEKYNLKDVRDWNTKKAKDDICKNPIITTKIHYRPFDIRYTNYTGLTKGIMAYPRISKMKNLVETERNVALVVSRQCIGDWRYVFCTDKICDINLTASAGKLGGGYVFPLYIAEDEDLSPEQNLLDLGGEKTSPNFDRKTLSRIEASLGRKTTPLELFDYIYAVLHHPAYRKKYDEFLKIDFPRIPYPKSFDEYDKLSKIGKDLRLVHLMDEEAVNRISKLEILFPVAGSNEVERVEYGQNKVFINEKQYFGNVPEDLWESYIGGYQPAQKWLKERKTRTLASDECFQYERIIKILDATKKLAGKLGEIKIC